MISVYTTLASLPDMIFARGWVVGPIFGIAVLAASLISVLELAPRFILWLISLHTAAVDRMETVGQALHNLAERLNRILHD
jgi:hypothetical protein